MKETLWVRDEDAWDAVPVIREFLGIEPQVAPPEILGEPERLFSYGILILGPIAPGRWRSTYIQSLRQHEGPLLLMGAPPAPVEKYLGLRVDGREKALAPFRRGRFAGIPLPIPEGGAERCWRRAAGYLGGMIRPEKPSFREVHAWFRQNESHVHPDLAYMYARLSRPLEVIRNFTTLHSLEGTRVLDLGCGLGILTAGMHLVEGAHRSLGVERNLSSVETGQEMIRSLGIEGLEIRQGDMREISGAGDRVWDLVTINNAINFFPKARDLTKTLASCHRVLRPGGALVILTPNFWHPVEASTKLRGVQFMPRPLATRYVRWRGRRAHYDDVRLPSPFDLRRRAREVGFRDVRILDTFFLGQESWKRYFKSRYYLVAER